MTWFLQWLECVGAVAAIGARELPMAKDLTQRLPRKSVLIAGAGSAVIAVMLATGFLQLAGKGEKVPVSAVTSLATQSAESAGAFAFHEEPKPVPDLEFVDGEGRPMTLDAFEGKTTLLNIWATWCVPCREEMPALDRLQAKLGGPEFQVVPLSVDREGLPKVEAFYEELDLRRLGIWNDPTASAAYDLGAVGLPTTLLLDANGRELGRLVGPAEWDSPEMVAVLQRHLENE